MTQHLDPARTTWHLTFGTYGTRLHGDDRPTVDRRHNQRGESFVEPNPYRANDARNKMRGDPIYLTAPQRAVVEAVIPDICKRGGWTHRMCAAPDDEDHVHVLLDAEPAIDSETILKWLKRWIGEALTQRWGMPISKTWWAKSGSQRAVGDESYLNRVYPYIRYQRTLPLTD